MTGSACLVACVAAKRPTASAPADLYTSPWFANARRFAEAGWPDAWSILSAEHGLVHPSTVTQPYDTTLSMAPRDQRRVWARRVKDQLAAAAPTLHQATALAGLAYREALLPLLAERGVNTVVPMAGLGIGQQLRWLDAHGPHAQWRLLFKWFRSEAASHQDRWRSIASFDPGFADKLTPCQFEH